jgi:tRNA 2-thiouridine synthesizing protein A
MAEVVNARGLSCPQPVIITVNAIKKGDQNQLTVLVDTDTAKENVSRATNAQGWKVLDIQPEGEGYQIKIAK